MSPKDNKKDPPKGIDFEKSVLNILSVLGYKVERDKTIYGSQIDIYGEYSTGIITLRLMVECKDYGKEKTVGINEVVKFAGNLSTARNSGVVDKGMLVTTNGFTRQAKDHARQAGIELTTFGELSTQLVNFDTYIDELISDFEGSPVGNAYIETTGTEMDDYEENSKAVFFRPIDDRIETCLLKNNQTKLALLGNFGTGKSTFCRHYVYTLARKYKQDKTARIPVLINLKEYDARFHIQSLILQTLQTNYGVNITNDLCLALQRIGRFLLIFDGFDEMDSKASAETIRDNLRELKSVSEIKNNKFIVTCRTHFFRNKMQVALLEDFTVLYIPEWEEKELKEYLHKKFGSDWHLHLQRISVTHNLPELARTPIFLEMIAETLPRLGDEVKRNELYQAYTDAWIKNQSKRKGALLSLEGRRNFVRALAMKLYNENRPSCHYKELLEVLTHYLLATQHEDDRKFEIDNAVQMDYLRNDVQTCTFLVRDLAGNYSFRHKSFMEFFVAQMITDEIRAGSRSSLERSIIPPDIRGFLVDFLKEDPSSAQFPDWMAGLEASVLKDNLLYLISMLGIKLKNNAPDDKSAETELDKLMVAFLQGDRDAFKMIYSQYHSTIEKYVSLFIIDRDQSEEIISDIFLKIWQRRSQLESVSNFKGYLFMATRNAIFNYLRENNIKSVLSELLQDIPDELSGPVYSEETYKAISEAMDLLTAEEKVVFHLIYTEGVTFREATRRLGLAADTVARYRDRALKKIRKYMASRERK